MSRADAAPPSLVGQGAGGLGPPLPSKEQLTLLVVYHRLFWRGRDGALWEREGAFSRYLEALAPHFGQVLVAAPEAPPPAMGNGEVATGGEVGHRVGASNVRLAALPYYDGLPRFFRALPMVLMALWRAVGQADLVNLRLPTAAGIWAFGIAWLRRRPVSLLVVGDLAGVAASVPRDNLKRRLYHLYVHCEERLLQAMVNRSLTFTNGRALYDKHARPGRPIFETRNSTIRLTDVGRPREPTIPPRARLLCVSRIDPRKGLRYLPAALAVLRSRGLEARLDLIGPTVGSLGEEERAATLEAARRHDLEGAVRFLGPASIEQVQQAYEQHDLLVVPSLPGEGIPRVLLEAMAAGLPVVATRVAGIPGLVRDGENGLLVPPADGSALGLAAARLLEDAELRARCVEGGYATAREHTAEAQAAWLADLMKQHARFRRQAPGAERVRITIPLASLNLSGGVKSLLQLANRLGERGAEVRVLTPDYASEPPIALDGRVRLTIVPTRGPGWLRKLYYLLQLSRLCAARSDLVLANYYLTAYPAFLSWLLHRRRAVLAYNIRGYEPWSHGTMAPASTPGRYLRFLLAWQSYRLPFRKLVTTDWLKGMVGDPGAIVVGHGIDLAVFRPSTAKVGAGERDHEWGGDGENVAAVVVGVIGRFGAVKGYPDFLEAVRQLPAGLSPTIRVARADPVPLPERFRVEAIEARDEAAMAGFYQGCDVFVFPSLAEGFGLPALEAMACGCAVVTTDCGGVSTFAEPDENCLMVPPGRPAELASAIRMLVQDGELRGRLGRAGTATARRFGREAALDRLADSVIQLAGRR